MNKRILSSAIMLTLVSGYPGSLLAQSGAAIKTVTPLGFSTTLKPTSKADKDKHDKDKHEDHDKDDKCHKKTDGDHDRDDKSPTKPPDCDDGHHDGDGGHHDGDGGHHDGDGHGGDDGHGDGGH